MNCLFKIVPNFAYFIVKYFTKRFFNSKEMLNVVDFGSFGKINELLDAKGFELIFYVFDTCTCLADIDAVISITLRAIESASNPHIW